MWDIEGRIVDTKSYDSNTREKIVKADEPLHEMFVRITMRDDFVIIDAEAFTANAPYKACPEINSAYKQLIGLSMGAGFNQKLRELFGGREGCTHITDLMGPIATTAFQTVAAWRARRDPQSAPSKLRPDTKRVINSCFAFRSEGDLVRVHFPEYYGERQQT